MMSSSMVWASSSVSARSIMYRPRGRGSFRGPLGVGRFGNLSISGLALPSFGSHGAIKGLRGVDATLPTSVCDWEGVGGAGLM